MGLILIGKAILYGIEGRFHGTIRLESLEVRESYYRDGIQMNQDINGEFVYSKLECISFLRYLENKGFFRYEEVTP